MSGGVIWLSLMFLPFLLAGLWLCAQVARKAGFSGWWCLAMLIPGLNILLIWVFAFIAWPREEKPGGAGETANTVARP